MSEPIELRLDLGAGPNKREGFLAVDRVKFPGVDIVCDLAEPIYADIPTGFEQFENLFDRNVLGYKRWPWGDESVTQAHSSHFVEHLTSLQRIHFVNELYRVLVPGGTCQIIVPHWASCRAYGDPTHAWSPVSEFWFYYLSRDWRKVNAPHTDIEHWSQGFSCDFDATWGYSLHPSIVVRNAEAQQFATQFYKEACQDTIATLTKK